MAVKLVSDYKDWYDHAFSPTGTVEWVRNEQGGFSKLQQLVYLRDQLKKATVEFGYVKDIVPILLEEKRFEVYGMFGEETVEEKTGLDLSGDIEAAKKFAAAKETDLEKKTMADALYDDLTTVVVYTDESVHKGEGKERIIGKFALDKYPDHLCSVWVPSPMFGAAFSRRFLSIGNVGFLLEYASTDDWRSNCGETQKCVVVAKFEAVRDKSIPYPIFAIDFVGANHLACDFNTAPGLAPLKDATDKDGQPLITATQIHDEVERFLATLNS